MTYKTEQIINYILEKKKKIPQSVLIFDNSNQQLLACVFKLFEFSHCVTTEPLFGTEQL